ncbi:hypothetical protein N5S71_00115 [Aliarcobacter cryaerophilus]|uniref:lipopolysaccharide biosynthesis protein n=1 Tax=Aliarcobacter cryaerophilus TaxID=28198 RepID=UPI0021B6ABAC|nr:hypothetical protein [Aliarcobacter cryaerophilus]MCT7460922.1 hypothetical protein [Aliarcobacter cryaerophilus]
MVNIKKIEFSDYQKTLIFNYLATGANILTGLILFPLIVKYLGMKELAMFGIFYSIKAFIDIGVGWLSASITKNLIKYKYLKDTIFTFSILWNFTYACIGSVLFILYGYFIKNEFLASSIMFGVFVFFSFLILPFYEMLISELKQSIVAFFRFLQQFLFFIFSVSVFIFADTKSLDSVFFILFLSSAFVFILIFIYYQKLYRLKIITKYINRKLFNKLIFSDGRDLFINAVVIIALLQIDVLLIDYLYGSVSAATYLILWKVPNTIIMLGWRLSEPFQAIIAKDFANKEKVLDRFTALEKKIFFVGLIAGIGYFIFGKLILEFWMGKDNIPDIDYMYLVPSIVIFLSILQRLYMSINFYTKGLNTVTFFELIELILKVIFTIFLFSMFNELSPIVGWMIGLMITIYFYRKNSIKVFI